MLVSSSYDLIFTLPHPDHTHFLVTPEDKLIKSQKVKTNGKLMFDRQVLMFKHGFELVEAQFHKKTTPIFGNTGT